MKLKKGFFDYVRQGIFKKGLTQSQVDGLNLVASTFYDLTTKPRETTPQINNVLKLKFLAYILATFYHETAKKMQPIKEYGGNRYFNRRYGIEGINPRLARRLGNLQKGDGARFAGRGFVQLTGRNNYQKQSEIHGVDLVNEPELMEKDAALSAKVSIGGMISGDYTGRGLINYIKSYNYGDSLEEYTQARRVVNGTDRAKLIANLAKQFETALIYNQ